MDATTTVRKRGGAGSRYGRPMKVIATSLLLSGCANYLFVNKQFGPGDADNYRLGSVPWGREKAIEEDLCGPKQYAAKWASGLVAARVLAQKQADEFVHNTCFNRANPHGPSRFEAQRELSQLAESLKPEQVGALNRILNEMDTSYTAERLEGMRPEAKLIAALLGIAGVGTVGGLAASGAFKGDKQTPGGGGGRGQGFGFIP